MDFTRGMTRKIHAQSHGKCILFCRCYIACKKGGDYQFEASGLYKHKKPKNSRIWFLNTGIRKHMFSSHRIYFIYILRNLPMPHALCLVILRIHIIYMMFTIGYKKLAVVVRILCKYFA